MVTSAARLCSAASRRIIGGGRTLDAGVGGGVTRIPNGSLGSLADVYGLFRIVDALNHFVRTYYWWFEDTDREDYVPAFRCPVCGESLAEVDDRNYRICESCSYGVTRMHQRLLARPQGRG